MANPKPNTRKWKAWQNLQPVGKPKLIVTAQVETGNTNQTPKLSVHTPPGINPKTRLLDLTIETSGEGNTVMDWRDVRYEEDIVKDQYTNVDVLWENNIIAQMKVETAE
jgi:hypothetical protein